jgi:multidrug efflux pump subunit AcrB
MGVALFTSLALALTWTPNLSQYFIKSSVSPKAKTDLSGNNFRNDLSGNDSPENALSDEESLEQLLAAEDRSLGKYFRRIVEFHQHWLQRALAKPWWLAGLSALLIASSYLCYRVSGTDLMPEMDEGGFTLDYWTPTGASHSAHRADRQGGPGGREHFAANRDGTWAGCSHRSQSRRHFGQAEAAVRAFQLALFGHLPHPRH